MSVKATSTNTGFFLASRRTFLQNLDQIFWITQGFLMMPYAGVLCREVWKQSQLWPSKTLGSAYQKQKSMPRRSHHEFLTGEHSLWLWWKLADDSIEKAHSNFCSEEFLVRIWGLVVITVLLMYHIKEELWSSDKGSERKQDGSCSVSHFLFYGIQLAVIITYYLSFNWLVTKKKEKGKETTTPKNTSMARKVVCGDFGSCLWGLSMVWYIFRLMVFQYTTSSPTTLAAILKWSSWPQIY